MKFVERNKAALGQVLQRLLRLFIVTTIPAMLRLHLQVPVIKRTKGAKPENVSRKQLFQKLENLRFSYFLTSVFTGLIVSRNVRGSYRKS